MNKKKSYLKSGLLLIIIGLSLFIYFNNDITLFEDQKAIGVGRILNLEGLTLGKANNSESFTSLTKKTTLTDKFQIITGQESFVKLQYGETFKVLPNSSVTLTKKGYRFHIELVSGAIERKKKLENVEFWVENKTQSALKIHAANSRPKVSITEPQENSLAVKVPRKLQKRINKTIKLHQRFLEKCFIKFYERQQGISLDGKVVVRFTLTQQGRIQKVSIKESDYDDELFHECIKEVLTRVRFKGYSGDERLVEFPIVIN